MQLTVSGFGHLWSFFAIALAASVLLVAWLVNRFAPAKRKRLRRLVVLFVVYLLSAGARPLLEAVGLAGWARGFEVASQLAAAFTVINTAALLVFDLALPAMSVAVVDIVGDLIVGVSYVVAIAAVLASAGVQATSVIATSAVVTGILALSLQATLGNVLGGVALQLDGSIHVGDWLQLENGRQGRVKQIRWRHTVLETRDWDTIIVPNSALLASQFTILGKREGHPVQHRMWVYFHVDFRHAPSRVMQVVEDALRAAPIARIASEPPPNCICIDFAKDGRDSYAVYAVRFWLTDLAGDDPATSEVRGRVHAALRRSNIPLARPVRTVFMSVEDEESDKKRSDRHRDRRLSALRSVELFRSLTPKETEYLADHVLYAPFAAGEIITRRGAAAHWLYVLGTGMVEVLAGVDGGPTRSIAEMKGPDYFGEMALLTGEPRSADVRALTDVECYRLDKEEFEKILRDRPEIARTLSATLAARRMNLIAVREDLDAEARRAREASEQLRILERIEAFFGLG